MKPSLHDLVRVVIYNNCDVGLVESDKIAEKIIKLIRDYHLVEDKPKASVDRYYDDIFGGG